MPKLNILPEAQRELWPLLDIIPPFFVLYGGTAVALRYGHRISVDFDFFTTRKDISPRKIGLDLPFIKNAQGLLVTNKSPSHTDFLIQNGHGQVQVTLMQSDTVAPGSLFPPDRIVGSKVFIASTLDLLATKIISMLTRTSAKDYIDTAYLIKKSGISLQKGFEGAYALSKLTKDCTDIMYPKWLKNFLLTDMEHRLENCPDKTLQPMAKYSAEILIRAAKKVDLEKVMKTKLVAISEIGLMNKVEFNERGR